MLAATKLCLPSTCLGRFAQRRPAHHGLYERPKMPDKSPRLGESGFDSQKYEASWGQKPRSMMMVEYCGDGDPAFGGSADDRIVLSSGMVAESRTSRSAPPAVYETVELAHQAALQIPNRRPNSVLGVLPNW